MKFKMFSTEKPRKFSFHTRYYNESKLPSEETATLEKGSFSKYKNRYRNNIFDTETDNSDRNRKMLIISIFIMLSLI